MNISEMRHKKILEIVEPIMENLMEDSTERNHEKHTRDFTNRLKKIVTKEALDRMCRDYQAKWGLFQSREFVALFRRKDSVAIVWKQSCSHTFDEFVAEAVFVEQNGRYLVDHAMVF